MEAGSTMSTRWLCGLSDNSLGKFSLGSSSAKLPAEDKSHTLHVNIVYLEFSITQIVKFSGEREMPWPTEAVVQGPFNR